MVNYGNAAGLLATSGDTTGATDTARIQTAAANGVQLGAGTFWINQTITLATGAVLLGSGQGVTTIKAAAGFAPTQVGNNTGAVMVAAKGNTGQSHLTIRDLTFDGNQANISAVPGYADGPECSPISIWNTSQAVIVNVEVLNPVGYAIYLQKSSESRIEGCRVLTGAGSALGTNQQDGIHLTGCTQVKVIGNDVDTGTGTAGDDGIAVQSLGAPAPSHDITISGNVIRAAQSGVHVAMNGGSNYNIAVTGNAVYAAVIAGVTIDTSGVGTGTTISVTGNTFQNIPSMVSVSVAVKGLTISGNTADTFTGSSQTGIIVTSGGSNLVVSSNVLTTTTSLLKGIQVGDTSSAVTGSAVHGNMIDMSGAGSGVIGILVRDSTAAAVTGNTVTGATNGSSTGIRIDGQGVAPTGNTVAGNTVNAWATGIAETNNGAAPDYNTLFPNTVHGCTASVSALGAHTIFQPVALDVGGVNDAEQLAILSGTYTLAANTSAQALFNVPSLGALTVAGSTTYEFECEADLTSLSASAHTLSFGLGGTATLTSLKYVVDSNTGAAATLATWNTAVQTTAAATAFTASVTTTTAQFRIRGTMRVNAAGTIIPQITQGTNGAAAVVSANSFFRAWPVGSNVVTTVGNWA